MGQRSIKHVLRNDSLEEAGVGVPLVEIAGDCRVLVERHKGVLGYDDKKVWVRLSFGKLQIYGCGLKIVHMSKTQLVVSGQIHGVVLQRS